jgi:hypothetical protein
MTDPKWPNSTVLGGDPVGQFGALKEEPGHDIVVIGSITLCHTLVGAGLIDEYPCSAAPSCGATAAGCYLTGSPCQP